MREKGYPKIRLGEAVDRITKGTTPTTHGFKYTSSGVAFIRVENLRNGVIDTSDTARYISPEANTFLKRSSLEAGDVLVSIAGTIGRVAVVRSHDLPANTNQAVAIIRGAKKQFEPIFLRYALENPTLHQQIIFESRGGAMQNISLEDVRSFQIPLPPIARQRQLIAEIEKQFTRLEAGVATLKRVQTNLKRYRATVLKTACEGRLVPTEADLARWEGRSHETGDQLLTRILTERRRQWQGRGKYKEPAGPNTANLPLLTKGWVWANILQLRVFSLYGPRFSSDDYAEDGYIVLRTSDISESGKVDITKAPRLRLSKDEFNRYRARRGDLLVTRTGSLGTLAIFDDEVEAIPGAYLIQFRLATEPVTTHYLFYFLKSPVGQRYLTGKGVGIGRPNLNAPAIEALSVPLPPLAEQVRIVSEVERRLSVIEEQEAIVAASLRRATCLRQSILQKAFSGKLVYNGN